jgi:hypothetical protein
MALSRFAMIGALLLASAQVAAQTDLALTLDKKVLTLAAARKMAPNRQAGLGAARSTLMTPLATRLSGFTPQPGRAVLVAPPMKNSRGQNLAFTAVPIT